MVTALQETGGGVSLSELVTGVTSSLSLVWCHCHTTSKHTPADDMHTKGRKHLWLPRTETQLLMSEWRIGSMPLSAHDLAAKKQIDPDTPI